MGDSIYSTIGTVANLESWLGLPPANTDEALLTRLLAMASQELQTAIGRSMVGVISYTQYYRVERSHRIALRYTPVTILTSVGLVAGQEFPSSPVAPTPITVVSTPQEGYAFLLDNMVYLPAYVPEGAVVQVVYSAGFATTPVDLEQAVYELAGLRYKAKDRIGQNSKNLNGEVVAFNTKRWNDFIEDVVAHYKSKVFS